jgi:hypothetical protein
MSLRRRLCGAPQPCPCIGLNEQIDLGWCQLESISMEIRQCLHWVAKESGLKDFIQEQSSYDDCHDVLRHGLTPYSRFAALDGSHP